MIGAHFLILLLALAGLVQQVSIGKLEERVKKLEKGHENL